MSLGEVPAGTHFRGYWHLENTNDSSGNVRNFINTGSVTFGSGKLKNAALFGTSGSKGLDFFGGVISADRVADITYGVWFKLNNTTSSNSNARLFVFSSLVDGTTDGCFNILFYNISGGNITIGCNTRLSTTNAACSYVTTPDSLWHSLVMVKSSTVNLALYYDGALVDSDTGSGTDQSDTQNPAAQLTLGNERAAGKMSQIWADVDEFFIQEKAWSASEVRRYYTQAKGRTAAA